MDPATIIRTLRRPLVDDATPGVFRLGLVLNGTVAAGAWTAGVLDTLFEALDAWEAARADGMDVPRHRVRIDVLGGASGGGVCAALLARAATRSFRHVTSPQGEPSNPFWQVWVEQLDIGAMLGTEDLAAPKAPAASLLDGRAIRLAAQSILDWGATDTADVTRLAQPRPWLADPFHVAVTLTNLRGVPYRIEFESGADGSPRSSWFVDHADHALFAFPSSPAHDGQGIRGDEFRVDADFGAALQAWTQFAGFVTATAAFPVGFPPVRLSRPSAQYGWRAVVLPGGKHNGSEDADRVVLLEPAWKELAAAHQPGETYSFDCVDGGACNNQPVELVRVALAGLGGRLERAELETDAGVLVIDPFAAAPECPGPTDALNLISVATGLAGTWKDQARFATSDLLLALDKNVCSRFLLTAGRTDAAGNKAWGGQALASAGLGAFLGFVDRGYRVHDYLLGRTNCREWLRKYFVLDQDNPVFQGFGRTGAAEEYRPRPGVLPLIPLVAEIRGKLQQPAWPVPDPATDELEGRIKDRLEAVVGRLGAQSGVPCNALLAGFLADWAAGYARRAIDEAAKSQRQMG